VKKFTFRLETLLRLRKQQEDDRKVEFAAAQAAVRDAKQELSRLLDERVRLERQWSERLKGTAATGESLRVFEDFRGHLFQCTEHAQNELTAARERETQARQALALAMRKVTTLENLRTRHELRHRDKQQKLEQSNLDESATMRFSRTARDNQQEVHS